MCNANSIMGPNLAGCHQIRKRLDEQTFDGALQWPGTISEVDTLNEQELPGAVCYIYGKGLIGQSGLDAPLYEFELDINDSVQLLIAQSFEDHDSVEAIEKLRREDRGGLLAAEFRDAIDECNPSQGPSCIPHRIRAARSWRTSIDSGVRWICVSVLTLAMTHGAG